METWKVVGFIALAIVIVSVILGVISFFLLRWARKRRQQNQPGGVQPPPASTDPDESFLKRFGKWLVKWPLSLFWVFLLFYVLLAIVLILSTPNTHWGEMFAFSKAHQALTIVVIVGTGFIIYSSSRSNGSWGKPFGISVLVIMGLIVSILAVTDFAYGYFKDSRTTAQTQSTRVNVIQPIILRPGSSSTSTDNEEYPEKIWDEELFPTKDVNLIDDVCTQFLTSTTEWYTIPVTSPGTRVLGNKYRYNIRFFIQDKNLQEPHFAWRVDGDDERSGVYPPTLSQPKRIQDCGVAKEKIELKLLYKKDLGAKVFWYSVRKGLREETNNDDPFLVLQQH